MQMPLSSGKEEHAGHEDNETPEGTSAQMATLKRKANVWQS